MNRLSGMRCYLAGTIEKSKDDGVGWRRQASAALNNLGVVVLDPTNRPCRLTYATSTSEEQAFLKRLRQERNFDVVAKCAQEIVHQDLRMVDVADFLVVRIDASVPTVGTIDEFATASNQKKPIFLSCEQGIIGMPLWMFGRVGKDWRKSMYETLEDSLEAIKQIATCSDAELDALIDRKKWLFLGLGK
jgi:nucleoside 2-deoxyribosyltransferase